MKIGITISTAFGSSIMKMVYTHENRFIVANAKNILQAQGIEVILKNEYTSAVIGEVSAFDAWLEIWVIHDEDYSRSYAILENSLSNKDAREWQCQQCKESNDASFELCWNCQKEHLE